MAYNIDENGKITKKKNGKIAESFMGVSGETGPMSKKEFKKFQQFIQRYYPCWPYTRLSSKAIKETT